MIGGLADERHFRVVELNGKKVEIGGVSITSKSNPSSAAKKLLSSIAHEKGLMKMRKLDLGKVHFKIQEYTRGSKNKIYGPYVGHFHKYTPAEIKKATIDKGKQSFKMKPVVKLHTKNNNKKMNNKKMNNKSNNVSKNLMKIKNNVNKLEKNMNK